MTLLALYWSIMIACYLLASRLRKYAEKFKFVDKLMSLSVYALVLLMGLRMGADEEVTSSLGSIGIQALFVTVLTAAGSMLGAFAVRKAAAHRPPRPPRRCSRQRSGGCARKRPTSRARK